MPVFSSIGVAIGAGVAGSMAAFAGGVGTVALLGGAAYGAYAMGAAGAEGKKGDAAGPAGVDPSTGGLSEGEAQEAAKKRLFRSGVMFSGTSGLGSGETLGQGRLK